MKKSFITFLTFKSSSHQHTALLGVVLPCNILYGASHRGVLLCAEREQMLHGFFYTVGCYSIQTFFSPTNMRGANVFN